MKGNKTELRNILISLIVLPLFFLNAFGSDRDFYTVSVNKNIDSLEIYTIDNIEYIDITVLSSILKLSSYYKKTQETIRMESNDSYVIISINSPFYKKAGKVFKMPYTPVYNDDIVLLPIYSIESVFKDIIAANAVFSEKSIAYAEKFKLHKVIEQKQHIDLVFNHIPSYEMETTLRDLIFFINDCSASKDLKQKKKTGLMRVFEMIEDGKNMTLIMTFDPKMELDFIKDIKDTLRIFFKERKTAPSNNNVMNIKTIIIDAGHGGKDPGAIGPTGLKEKVVTLDIASRLKQLITSNMKDIKVIMIRDKDIYVSLQERTMLANKYPDAIFISIHCNASYNKQAKGAETYFLSTAKTDWQRAVEARENASLAFDIKTEDKEGLDFILWDLAQNEFLSESSHIAELIQKQFESNTKNCRGLNQAGFYVLKGNYMPAVLVETAFISNPEEEKMLKTSDFRQKLANNIYKGIVKYINDYEKKNK